MTTNKPGANLAYAKAVAELRRSNAAGVIADKRTKRQRDRGAKRRAAIKDAS